MPGGTSEAEDRIFEYPVASICSRYVCLGTHVGHMGIKHKIRKGLWRVGYDICRFDHASHPLARRQRIFRHYEIDTVIDVGANAGHFAQELRMDIGYIGGILSFEPLGDVFDLLEMNAKNDPNWKVFNFALGDNNEKREINRSENSLSSSLLEMLPSHLESAPNSKYVAKQMIEIRTLDSIFDEVCKGSGNIYMKIDTQGFESKVLKGSECAMEKIDTIQMEMSLIPLYGGEVLFEDMCAVMRGKGYSLIAIENGFSSPESGQLLQVDGIFRRLARDERV